MIGIFGSKTFVVSSKKIYTPNDISRSIANSIDHQETAGEKPASKIKSIGLKEAGFNLHLDSQFVDVEKEISDWESLAENKVKSYYTLGGKLVSVNKFVVKSVSTINIVIGSNHKHKSADVAITLEEFAREATEEAADGDTDADSASAGNSKYNDLMSNRASNSGTGKWSEGGGSFNGGGYAGGGFGGGGGGTNYDPTTKVKSSGTVTISIPDITSRETVGGFKKSDKSTPSTSLPKWLTDRPNASGGAGGSW